MPFFYLKADTTPTHSRDSLADKVPVTATTSAKKNIKNDVAVMTQQTYSVYDINFDRHLLRIIFGGWVNMAVSYSTSN